MEKSIGKHKLNILHACMASALVLVIFAAVSIVCGITPFGDNTFLMSDLKRQYVDYYAYLRTIMSGENDTIYSFSTTLGSGIIGFFTYYLSSPFLVILNFFPQTALPVGISMVICLKLMIAAFVMELFLQRFVNGKGILMCSVSWAFSGYLFAHSMNMMWMDVVIMLPLAVWSLEHILENNRKVPYIVVLCLMLAFNYYISYQVLLFLGMWTLVRVFVRNDSNKLMQVLRVFVATVTAALIDGIMLVPTALQLLNSPKDIVQLGLKLTGKNLHIIDVFSKAISCSYDYLEGRSGYPQIFCGVLLIYLLLLYFMDRDIKLRERIGMLVMFAVLLISFCLDALNVVWHAGMEPSGHPYRQAFLWIFLVVVCCAKVLAGLKENLYYDRVVIATALNAILLVLIARGNYDHAPLKIVLLNFAMVAGYSVSLFLLTYCRKHDIKTLPIVIMAAVLVANIGDLSLNAVRTYEFQALNAETESFFSSTVRNNLEAVNHVKGKDSSFYRMENLHPRQQNDSLQYNYNGVTHYSSAGMIYVRYFLQRLGFNDDGLHANYGHDNTALADMLLGIKYVLSDGTYSAHSDYDRIFDGAVDVYENPRALSVAVETSGYDLSGITDPETGEADAEMPHVPVIDPFSLQEEILSRLLGKEISIFEPAVVKSGELTKGSGSKCYVDHSVTASGDGELYMYLDGLIGAKEGLVIYVDGEQLSTYGNASCVKILNLGYRKKGESIVIRVQAENKSEDMGRALFVTENTDALNAAYDEIREKNCLVTKKASSKLIIETGDCTGIFTTVPYETGWKITVDGRKVEPVAVYDSFMYIPIEDKQDSHVVRMSFISPGVYSGVAVTVIGMVMLALIIMTETRKAGKRE